MSVAAGLFLAGVLLLVMNLVTFEDETLDAVSNMLLLAAANFAVAAPIARVVNFLMTEHQQWAPWIAAGLVVLFLAMVCLDYVESVQITGHYSDDAPVAATSLVKMLVCVSAFSIMWLSFTAHAGARYPALVSSLVLACLAATLFFVGSWPNLTGGDAGAIARYVRFCLTCVSLATAISGFVVQRQSLGKGLSGMKEASSRHG